MHPEHKSNLEKALVTQTWNKNLSRELMTAIEEELKKPKKEKKLSALQLAVQKEKGEKVKSSPNSSEGSEEQ